MKEYIVYKCLNCNKSFILLANEVKYSESESNYITCPYHGQHKRIVVTGAYDSLKETMDNRVYVKEGRRTRQVK